jgi:hypothetical protein
MWDFSKFLEVTIDRTAKEVWPYLFRKHNDVWSRTSYTSVAGKMGQVGEMYEMAYPIPEIGGHLYFESIKVEPEKHCRISWEWTHPISSEWDRRPEPLSGPTAHVVARRRGSRSGTAMSRGDAFWGWP